MKNIYSKFLVSFGVRELSEKSQNLQEALEWPRRLDLVIDSSIHRSDDYQEEKNIRETRC